VEFFGSAANDSIMTSMSVFAIVCSGFKRGRLEQILPEEMTSRVLASGKKLVLPFSEALAAITIATNHQIAVLGLEAFEVRNDGLQNGLLSRRFELHLVYPRLEGIRYEYER
jgi:hypothetical protein